MSELPDQLRQAADELEERDDYEEGFPETTFVMNTRVVYEDEWVSVHEDPGGDYWIEHHCRDETLVTSENDIYDVIETFVEEQGTDGSNDSGERTVTALKAKSAADDSMFFKPDTVTVEHRDGAAYNPLNVKGEIYEAPSEASLNPDGGCKTEELEVVEVTIDE